MPPIVTDVWAEDSYALPTSLAQQRIWFYSQLALQSPFYNIPLRFRLAGLLDSNVLTKSIELIVARHEALRTAIASVEGQPQQIIRGTLKVHLPLVDLSDDAQPEQNLRQLETREAQVPFDLNRGPLFRCSLVRLSEQEHELLLTMHHIIADGWSVGVFVRELTEIYTAYARGVEPSLAELPIQYADYAIWQREWIDSPECQAQLDYWRQQLDGFSPLQLLTDRPRPSEQSFRGGHQPLALDRKLSDKLRSFSESHGVTLFMTLLAALQTLLYRYTDSRDIAVGSPIANRNREELEGLIGFFANSVVLRNEFSDELTFLQLLQRVKESTLSAYAHQDLPFDKLVDELQPERATNRNPLFQVVFALQNAPVEELDLAGVKLCSPGTAGRSDIFDSLAMLAATRFDLELHLWDQADGICGGFLYSTDLFDSATIRRMSEHFRVLLEGIIRDPEQHLRQLPLLTPAERELLLTGRNQTATDYPTHSSIQALFEEQARQTPQTIAISDGSESLSYEALNERANQLARYLQSQLATDQAEVLVGVMLKRSVDLVVALLGILKAGGAYVPLDPGYPAERLRFMIADTGIASLITNDSFRDLWSDLPIQAISLDREKDLISAEPRQNPGTGTTPDSLAYVMYTSGSTGTPKGICVEHRSVVRLVRNTNYAVLNEQTVMLQFAPVSFDASTFEIWGALLNGGRLAVFGANSPSLAHLGTEIRKCEVNTMWLTAGLFHLMVDERLADLCGVKQLLAGGDVLSVSHVKRFLKELPACRLINGYGPTENTTFTCCHVMTSESEIGSTVPIGRPIANTRVYLLDQAMQPVPIGVPGELYAGGDGVARGYLNRDELTAERFISDPFVAGSRLYKTGDLARYLNDGAIEFLGRKDNQVKIRGFRVELGEIEAAIKEHPLANDCAVVVREDEPGEKRLVAYVVPNKGIPTTSDTVSDLRSSLRERLPEYLVPAQFVLLTELPLSPNGKVDRNRLPAPDVRSDLETVYVAPQTEVERTIAAIWQATLRIEKVGRHDNFFELGGHSLDVTQVHSKLSKTINKDLMIVDLFKYPTIESLARHLSKRQSDKPSLNGVRSRAEKQKQVMTRRGESVRQRRNGNERVGK